MLTDKKASINTKPQELEDSKAHSSVTNSTKPTTEDNLKDEDATENPS